VKQQLLDLIRAAEAQGGRFDLTLGSRVGSGGPSLSFGKGHRPPGMVGYANADGDMVNLPAAEGVDRFVNDYGFAETAE
jgi:hypothetical protein